MFQLPALLLLIGLLSGCATMIDGSSEKIKVHFEQQGNVSILVNGDQVELVNGFLMLDKSRDAHFVSFQQDGYNERTLYFNREINPFWPVADLIWGPFFPIAWAIDWTTAAVYRIDPQDIRIVMRKKEGE